MLHGTWSKEEHDKFLDAIKLYPQGPWRFIAGYVGTRSVRQVQTHAQKYHEKIARRMRGVRKDRRRCARQEHRIDEEIFMVPHHHHQQQYQQQGTPTEEHGYLAQPMWHFEQPLMHASQLLEKSFVGTLPPLRYPASCHFSSTMEQLNLPYLPWPHLPVHSEPSP